MQLPSKIYTLLPEERIQFLSSYFSGKNVSSQIIDGKFFIDLDWHDDASFYIDTDLENNLHIFDQSLDIYGIPMFKKQFSRYNLTLNDNWTLFFWSRWLEMQTKSKGSSGHVIIIHIDDHYDCMAPLLFKAEGDKCLDPITGLFVTMDNPDSIASAISSGAITIGSFVTPFLHSLDSFEFRYLMPESRFEKAYGSGCIDLTDEVDYLYEDKTRPSLKFNKSRSACSRKYIPSIDIDEIFSEIDANASVIIHIDMDYFSNRFDGDSDWSILPTRHDPQKHIVVSKIIEILNAINTKIDRNQLVDFTIALSPGFFPSEYWEDCINLFDEHLNSK